MRRTEVTEILKNFWVLEGLDGSGTTTQLKKLKSEFENRNIPYFLTCEPTVYETGKFLRRILSGEIKIPQSSIAHMFSTDRDNHLYNSEYGILKHLNDGKIVVSDRYFFSSFAYQSIGFNYDIVKTINGFFPYPEKVIYIDTPPEECLRRIENRGNKKEIFEKLEYQKKVRENYEKCFMELPEGCTLIRIDGTLSKDAISDCLFLSLFG